MNYDAHVNSWARAMKAERKYRRHTLSRYDVPGLVSYIKWVIHEG